jgi:hypothetical protein
MSEQRSDWLIRPLTSRSRGVWIGARLAAVALGGILVWAMLALTPIQPLLEPPAIQAIRLAQIEVPRPARSVPSPIEARIPEPTKPQVLERVTAPAVPMPSSQAPATAQAPLTQDRPTPVKSVTAAQPAQPAAPAPKSVPTTAPRIATAPSGQASDDAGPTRGAPNADGAGRLTPGVSAMLRARECARIDIAQRPADCPPNAELLRLLAVERDPKYRPENAEGFSRNELAWRGIPPPCLDNGETRAFKNGKLCVRIGTPPSRVRTVREICEARGLGGCEPAPSQAAVNAALEQVRRAQAPGAPK